MADKTILDKVHAVLKETASLIVTKHHIPQAEQDEYVSKIIARFSNPALKDSVARVGRQPLR
jgi:mannitol-1-phosphate 5-dehydrogenase